MKAFFHKLIFSTPCYLSTGSVAPFVGCGDDEGYLATDHEWLKGELRALAARQVGGVSEISEAQFEELKKKPASPYSLRQSPDPNKFLEASRIVQREKDQRQAQSDAATDSPKPEPNKKIRVSDIAASRPKPVKVT